MMLIFVGTQSIFYGNSPLSLKAKYKSGAAFRPFTVNMKGYCMESLLRRTVDPWKILNSTWENYDDTVMSR